MEVEASFPADGETFELVELGECLLDDVAKLPEADDVALAPAEDHRQDVAFASVTDPAGHGRDSIDQWRVWVTSLTLAAVVITWKGMLPPSLIRWCLRPVLWRSTGGPVASPPFSRAYVGGVHVGARPVDQFGRATTLPGACGARHRPPRPAASGRADAGRSARSRSPAPNGNCW